MPKIAVFRRISEDVYSSYGDIRETISHFFRESDFEDIEDSDLKLLDKSIKELNYGQLDKLIIIEWVNKDSYRDIIERADKLKKELAQKACERKRIDAQRKEARLKKEKAKKEKQLEKLKKELGVE